MVNMVESLSQTVAHTESVTFPTSAGDASPVQPLLSATNFQSFEKSTSKEENQYVIKDDHEFS